MAAYKPLTSNSKTPEGQVTEKFELNVIFVFIGLTGSLYVALLFWNLLGTQVSFKFCLPLPLKWELKASATTSNKR